MNEVSIDRLRELFDLTPCGLLINRKSRRGRVTAGAEAGYLGRQGYREVAVDGERLLVHRVVYAMLHRAWPKGQVDHINGVRDDNRPANLRDVSREWNCQNTRSAFSTNQSGMLGVSPRRERWCAAIHVDGRQIYLGTYDNPEAAHAAYVAAKRVHHPACTI